MKHKLREQVAQDEPPRKNAPIEREVAHCDSCGEHRERDECAGGATDRFSV